MEEVSEHCKSCHSYNAHIHCPILENPKLTYKCICGQCILKSMCQSACRPYFDLMLENDLINEKIYSREIEALEIIHENNRKRI